LHPQDGVDKVMIKNGLGDAESVSGPAQIEAVVSWMQKQPEYHRYFPGSSSREGGGA